MLDARRKAYLAAMGIELWMPRSNETGDTDEPQTTQQRTLTNEAAAGVGHAASGSTTVQVAAEHANTEFFASSEPLPEESIFTSEPASDGVLAMPPQSDSGSLTSNLSWGELQDKVVNCHTCSLHQTRTQTVFGVGDPDARLMIIGEAPGADEDRRGEPFVGRAGQLLNLMLEAIGFRRDQVYIANIIKCRPPGNRDPHAEEAAACQGYLHRQIELIGPDLILSVGRVSAHNLLSTDLAVGRLRGRTHRFQPGDIPLIVTYHPAYLLRRPQEKAKAWQDLQQVHRVLQAATEDC